AARVRACGRNANTVIFGVLLLGAFAVTNIVLLQSVLQSPGPGEHPRSYIGPLLRERLRRIAHHGQPAANAKQLAWARSADNSTGQKLSGHVVQQIVKEIEGTKQPGGAEASSATGAAAGAAVASNPPGGNARLRGGVAPFGTAGKGDQMPSATLQPAAPPVLTQERPKLEEQKLEEQKPAEQKAKEQKPASQGVWASRKKQKKKAKEQKLAEQKPAAQKPAEQKPPEQATEVLQKAAAAEAITAALQKAAQKPPEEAAEVLQKAAAEAVTAALQKVAQMPAGQATEVLQNAEAAKAVVAAAALQKAAAAAELAAAAEPAAAAAASDKPGAEQPQLPDSSI
ncbi:unnamed protein product, partial [Polarella glacialis]